MTTLAGYAISRAVLQLPSWGVWFADVELPDPQPVEGAVVLDVAGRAFRGTVVSGGVYQGRARYRVAGGAGGWGRVITEAGYDNDAGVKLATVITAAAEAVGETFAGEDNSAPPARTGAHFTRRAGPASQALNILSPRAWYIDDAGVTRLGTRPATEYSGDATQLSLDLAAGVVEFAADSVIEFSPGVTAGGITASDVEIEITPTRITVRLFADRSGSRSTSALHQLISQIMPEARYAGVWEYRVVGTSGERLNLQPVRTANGLPELSRVPVRYGLPGARAQVADGSLVLVSFVGLQPSRPVVVSFDDPESPGWIPTQIAFDATTSILIGSSATLGVARLGDAVIAGAFGGTITAASTKVRAS